MRVLLILNSFSTSVLDYLKTQPVDLKAIYYGGRLSNDVAIKYWGRWADVVIVEDNIFNELSQASDTTLWPVSRYKEAIQGGETRRKTTLGAAVPQASTPSPYIPPSNPVLFFPTNDTHVKMFYPIARVINNYTFAFTGQQRRRANTELALRSLGEEFERYKKGLIGKLKPSVIVFGNDWGRALAAMEEARSLNIPTVCIQEGCLDWADPQVRRMEWCDFPFIQGPMTLKYLDREIYFVTGNPRFDSIRKLPLPEQPKVMINCNFTSKIHEVWRDRWVGDVVLACKQAGLDYFISQHPRDKGEFNELPVKPSSPLEVHEHLAQSSLLVTRFSTLVYEAILMGRSVVYYNPHGEKMRTFEEDATGGLAKVHNADELSQAIISTIKTADDNSLNREQFLQLHCGLMDHGAAERCAAALCDVVNWYSAGKSVQRAVTFPPSSGRLISTLISSRLFRSLLPRCSGLLSKTHQHS